jgi:hypothetical protein
MIHPGITDLSHLTDPQVEEKLFQLNRYYFIADNPDVRQQILLAIDSYTLELEERRAAARRKQQEEQGENPLDGLINVS